MHIALVTETYPPEINGVALTLHSLAGHLVEQGHRISLIRPRQDIDQDADAGGPHACLLVPGTRLPRYRDLRFGWPVTGQIRRFWQRQRPDAVYIATEGPLGWAALRTARALRLPVATGFHTRFDDYAAHYGLKFLTPMVFGWMRRFHNRAQATVVPTRELQAFLSEHGFQRVERIDRAVDIHRFDPAFRDPDLRRQWQLGDDGLAVIHVGRIAAEKNLDLAVRAFRAIAERHPGSRFILVGDGPERARLQRQNPDFVFAGVRTGQDLARHYASADLFVFPSQSETFGNVTLEAMASGLAVVAFDYGAACEHITDPSMGRTVAIGDGDADAFLAAACDLASDRAVLRATGARARTAMLRLSPEDVTRRFAGLMTRLQLREAA